MARPRGQKGLELCEKHKSDLIMLDLVLPDGEGITLVPEIRKLVPRAKSIGMSGYMTNDTQPRVSVRQGIFVRLRYRRP